MAPYFVFNDSFMLSVHPSLKRFVIDQCILNPFRSDHFGDDKSAKLFDDIITGDVKDGEVILLRGYKHYEPASALYHVMRIVLDFYISGLGNPIRGNPFGKDIKIGDDYD